MRVRRTTRTAVPQQQQIIARPIFTVTGRPICPKCKGAHLSLQDDAYGHFVSCGFCGYEYTLDRDEARQYVAQHAATRGRKD